MGTDIHAFVEVDYGTKGGPFGEAGDVRCFNQGEFYVRNVYELFDALGNGRNRHFPPDSVGRWALFPPRGLPANVSRGVVERYSHAIIAPRAGDVGRAESETWPGLRAVTRDEAERWVEEGWSDYYFPPTSKLARTPEPCRVSHPDWRHASWLLLPEIHQALAHFGLEVAGLSPEVEAILSAMEAFERRLGTGRTRLVFWFDN